MIRTLLRDASATFPTDDADSFTALRVWHCKYRSLSTIAAYRNLTTLVVATYPDADLSPVASLHQLRYLSLLHLPKVQDLSPLGALARLETLRLATLPSWDASGKITTVESLDPIADCPQLRHLELFGVCPRDRSLRPLERAPMLVSVRVSKYPRDEEARYRAASKVTDAYAPSPPIADW